MKTLLIIVPFVFGDTNCVSLRDVYSGANCCETETNSSITCPQGCMNQINLKSKYEILITRTQTVNSSASYENVKNYCSVLQSFGATLSSTCLAWCAKVSRASAYDEPSVLDCLGQIHLTTDTMTLSSATRNVDLAIPGVFQMTYVKDDTTLVQTTAFESIADFKTDYTSRINFYNTPIHKEIYGSRTLTHIAVVAQNRSALSEAYAEFAEIANGKADLELSPETEWS